MSDLEQTLIELASKLKEGGISYMVIGGIANAVWGEPRVTLDIDVTIWVPVSEASKIVSLLEALCRPLVPDPADFVQRTSVLPMQAKGDVRIDLIFGSLPFEKEAIERAVEVEVGETSVRFATPEDLIITKIVSERQRDADDVRAILSRQRSRLDFTYLDPRISKLSGVLERPEIWRLWLDWKNEFLDRPPRD
jgi:predicted nucleotidyltransferase